jgi:hypothetical protein
LLEKRWAETDLSRGQAEQILRRMDTILERLPWVVRQAHVITSGPVGITDHRVYCCGPREGDPELGPVYAEAGR